MTKQIEYSRTEKIVLWSLGAFGLLGINSVFFYGLFSNPDVLTRALKNPISLAFIIEAIVLMMVFAYLLSKWGVTKLKPWWFILLSLIGSMAFALPVVILWSKKSSLELKNKQ